MINASASAEARFRACLAQTLKWEGGYSNDKYDPGGATMHGIIQREYDAYRARKSLPKQSVRQISKAEEEEIYRHSYWDEVRGEELPAGVDLAVFDYGVNSGPPRAVKSMQRALGVKADGRIGQITLDAIAAEDPDELVEKIMAERRQFLRGLKTFWRFGKGWMTRCDGIEHQGLAWGGSPVVAFGDLSPVQPNWDAEVQSASQGRAYDETPDTAWDTQEGKTAVATGTAGGVGTGLAVAKAAGAAYVSGQGFDFALFIITLASSEIFWISATAIVSGVTGWMARGHLIKQEAV